uniref:Predicted protein n=1 Tax=Physcomitrium patens TaxID=3218 RepID=A9U5N4_PHYPA
MLGELRASKGLQISILSSLQMGDDDYYRSSEHANEKFVRKVHFVRSKWEACGRIIAVAGKVFINHFSVRRCRRNEERWVEWRVMESVQAVEGGTSEEGFYRGDVAQMVERSLSMRECNSLTAPLIYMGNTVNSLRKWVSREAYEHPGGMSPVQVTYNRISSQMVVGTPQHICRPFGDR